MSATLVYACRYTQRCSGGAVCRYEWGTVDVQYVDMSRGTVEVQYVDMSRGTVE